MKSSSNRLVVLLCGVIGISESLGEVCDVVQLVEVEQTGSARTAKLGVGFGEGGLLLKAWLVSLLRLIMIERPRIVSSLFQRTHRSMDN